MIDEKETKSLFSGLTRPRPPEAGIPVTNGHKKKKPKDAIDAFTQRFELPRVHYKPVDGIDFFADGSLEVTANMGYAQVAAFTLPKGHEGVIKLIGQGADSPVLFTDCRWQLLLNGAAVRNWFDFSFQRGTLSAPLPVTIFLPTSSTVSFQVRNTGAFPYLAKAIFIGWSWIVKEITYASMSSKNEDP